MMYDDPWYDENADGVYSGGSDSGRVQEFTLHVVEDDDDLEVE